MYTEGKQTVHTILYNIVLSLLVCFSQEMQCHCSCYVASLGVLFNASQLCEGHRHVRLKSCKSSIVWGAEGIVVKEERASSLHTGHLLPGLHHVKIMSKKVYRIKT